MTVPVELSPEEIKEIKRLTKVDDDAEAVGRAARDFLRLRRLQELKAISGKVDYDDNWQQLESLESSELNFPK
jgi:hypothetical protein